jgi:hypothetical protein
MRVSNFFDVLVSLDDYSVNELDSTRRTGSLALTAGAVFALLWAIEFSAYTMYRNLPKELNKKEYLVKFGRHTMDIVAMVVFSYMGFEALGEAPFNGWDAIHTIKSNEGNVLSFGHARSYIFSPAAQRLCVWQVAYQLKNFVDAVLHNDGPLFLAHHLVTGLLSVSFRQVFFIFSLTQSTHSTLLLILQSWFACRRFSR